MQKKKKDDEKEADDLTPLTTTATETETATTLGRAYREAVSSVIASAVLHAFRTQQPGTGTDNAALGIDALAGMVSPLASQRLQLVRPLGKGACGSVYLMRSLLDGRLEAVKQISFVSEVPPWATTSFHDDAVREVRALAACQESPYIVRYYHSWTEPDWAALRGTEYELKGSSPQGRRKDMWPHVLYISMEPVFGATLEAWLRDRNERFFAVAAQQQSATASSFSFGPTECLILRQMAEGLAHVHEQGIIHRDLKPSNIFVVAAPPWQHHHHQTKPRVKLADFGLAAVTRAIRPEEEFHDVVDKNDNARLLLTAGVGTPTYSAPETLSPVSMGEATTEATDEDDDVAVASVAYGPEADVYSMGLIALEMVFPFATHMERARVLCDARKNGDIPRKEVLEAGGLSAGLVALLTCMIDRCPARRPSARDVADTLHGILSDRERPPREEKKSAFLPPPPPRRRRRHTF